MGVHAFDYFDRNVASGWGTSIDGHVWSHPSGTDRLSVSNGWGVLTHQSGSTDYNTFLLGSEKMINIEVLGKMYCGDPLHSQGIIVRSDALGNNGIILRWQPASGKTRNIQVCVISGGVLSVMASYPIAFDLDWGTVLWYRFRASGTTFSCKCWANGQSEPFAWAGVTTIASLVSGYYGYWSAPAPTQDTPKFGWVQFSDTTGIIETYDQAAGRFSLKLPQAASRYMSGRARLMVRDSNNMLGRFVLRESLNQTGITIYIGNTKVTPYADPVVIDDKVNQRSQASFSVVSANMTSVEQHGRVEIWEAVRGRLFSGVIDSINFSRVTNNSLFIWKVNCKDWTYLADKRLYRGKELKGYLAGDMVAYLQQSTLAQEGVTSNLASAFYQDQPSWALGTPTGVVASDDDTLTLSPAGGTFLIAEDTQEVLASGTLTGVAAVNGQLQLKATNALKLTGSPIPGKVPDSIICVTFWKGAQVIASGDYLEYDVWVPSTCPEQKGGVDLIDSTGTEMRNAGSGTTWDQNGIDMDTNTVLGNYARDQWYHRKFPMASGWVGKTVALAVNILDGNGAGSYTTYVKNVNYRASNGTLKTAMYAGAATPAYNLTQKNVGYQSAAMSVVTTYETKGQRISPLYTNTICDIVQDTGVSWKVSGTTDEKQVSLEVSYDNKFSWVPLANNSSIPTIYAGANLDNTNWYTRVTLSQVTPTPETTPYVDYLYVMVRPSYAATVTPYSKIEAAGSFSSGVLVNTVDNPSWGLTLTTILASQWDNGDMSGMTAYGSGNISLTPFMGAALLGCDASGEAHAQLNFVGSIANFVLECDLVCPVGGGNSGIVYRTTYWGSGSQSYGYTFKLSSGNGIEFGHGSNSSGSTWTSITTYTPPSAYTEGSTYHMTLVVNGTSHTCSIDGTQVISRTDSFTTSAGGVGIRFSNNGGSRTTVPFDNFGIVPAVTSLPVIGTRVSPALALSGTVGHSVIFWDEVDFGSGTVFVEASIDGVTYLACSNGGSIPGLDSGVLMTGKNLTLRETLTAQNANAFPTIAGLHAAVYSAYTASGTWVSPPLSLSSVGRVGDTSVSWDASLPVNTGVTAESNVNGGAYTLVSGPGAQISGITSQPDLTLDDFSSDTHSAYTPLVSTWAWDTSNSRLTATWGASVGVCLSLMGAVADGVMQVVLNQAASCGIVFRYTDSNNYYKVVISDVADTVSLYKRVAGVETLLGGTASIVFPRGTYHILQATFINTSLIIRFDGAPVITVTDSQFNSGSVGMAQFSPGLVETFYQFRVQPYGQDVTGMTAGMRLTLTSTDPAQTPVVNNSVLSVRSPDIMSGAFLQESSLRNKSIASGIEDGAKKSNFWWSITDGRKLLFQSRDALPAPWVLNSGDFFAEPSPTVTFQGTAYRNRQWVTDATLFVNVHEQKAGNGVATSWSLAFPIVSVTSVTVNGATRTVGLQGQSGKAYYYAPGQNTFGQDQGATPLATNEVLDVYYTGAMAYDAVAEDASQQQLLRARDSTSGIVEATESGAGVLQTEADTLAAARITQFARITRDWSFTTQKSGLVPGASLTVYVPELFLNDVTFLITGVRTTLRPGVSLFVTYDVNCTEGPPLGSWARVFIAPG